MRRQLKSTWLAARNHALPFRRRSPCGEAGQALILVSLMLVPMIMMLALAVDLGIAYGAKRQLQNVADNGALAGTQVLEKRLRAGFTPTDAEVVAAIADIATHSPGGLSGVSIGPCGTGGSGNGIQGSYIKRDKTIVGTVGAGGAVPSAAWGVQLTPCKKVPTNFARVVGINDIGVGASGSWAFGVVTGISTDNGSYGPFGIWYGEVAKRYDPSNPKSPQQQCIDDANNVPGADFGCIGAGSTIVYRANGWGDCPNHGGNGLVLAESTCTEVNSVWSVGNTNFKGDINHGAGWVPVGQMGDPETIQTNGGNAEGQYVARLDFAAANPPSLMLMPLITEGKKVGGDISIKTVGFACVKVNSVPNNTNTPYTAEIVAIGEGFESHSQCHSMLTNVRLGETTITETSVTVSDMIQ